MLNIGKTYPQIRRINRMEGRVVPTDNPTDIHPMLDTQENESD